MKVAGVDPIRWPLDPLDGITVTKEDRRRTIGGILESYNSNYDALTEAVQNSVDALEDGHALDLKGPFTLEITVDLKDNWISILDTGVGMDERQVSSAFAPNVSFKNDQKIAAKRGKNSYRGYKGVGLTFLAYSTDAIILHSKRDGKLTKVRMQYGRAWADGDRPDPALVAVDNTPSPLDKQTRGTYVRVQFGASTRPASLSKIASQLDAWAAIVRTRTAAGQILLKRPAMCPIQVKLNVVTNPPTKTKDLAPEFLYPHTIERKPAFRFLDLVEYFEKHGEQATPPPEKLRQDGLYLTWDTKKISEELTTEQRAGHQKTLDDYTPVLYAFVPYQGSVWGEMNQILTGVKNRSHLYPGLLIGINRQRLADKFEVDATRFETFSRNVLIIVHFDNARPDQGRKTVQDEVMELAKHAADRAVQYLAKQKDLLKPAGDAPTPGQREVERSHEDWLFNVKTHAKTSPLHIPPASFASEPLAEQDVVGLFHQLPALGVFPGIRIFATSQVKTYDCLIEFNCDANAPSLKYSTTDVNPLGVSPYVLGTGDKFSSRSQTLEFKNNLDALIDELGSDTTKKSYGHIHICVCWATLSDKFDGYTLEEITETNLDARRFPGVTHILHRDGDAHTISVVMLKRVVELIKRGIVPIGENSGGSTTITQPEGGKRTKLR